MRSQFLSMRSKLFVIIFAGTIIPIIIVSVLLYISAVDVIKYRTANTIIKNIDFTISNIDSMLKTIEFTAEEIFNDDVFQELASEPRDMTNSHVKEVYPYILNLLRQTSYSVLKQYQYKGIDSYYLYFNRQGDILNSKRSYKLDIDKTEVDFLAAEINTDSQHWFVAEPLEYTINEVERNRLNNDKIITLIKHHYNENGEELARLMLNISETYIESLFYEIENDLNTKSVIINRDGSVLTHLDNNIVGTHVDLYSDIYSKIEMSDLNKGSFYQDVDNVYNLAIYSRSTYTGWYFVRLIPISTVLGEVGLLQNTLLIIVAIAILVVFFVTYMMSNFFYKPIEKLKTAMAEIGKRNFTYRVTDKRRDEYQVVYQGFNKMAAELDSAMVDLTNEKILKKVTEIKFLQSQINPHFLYNILETINSIAKIKGVTDISKMVTALSKYFRSSINVGDDIVTLKSALQIVVDYITIQNIRFNGKIKYHSNVPNHLLNCKLPKLILQPIVENSFYHGLEKKADSGILTITASEEDNNLKVIVQDDGIGIKPDSLEVLNQSINDANFDEGKNFALKNLNMMIHIIYGKDYGITINSVWGKGTTVVLVIPIVY